MNACVSIVIPVYNGEASVLRCLRSVQAQTYKKLDVILVDDGSTDSSQMICREFCSQDGRFRLLCPPHGGVSHARNTGIANAKGDYLMFLDGDDEVLSDMVERYLQTAHSTHADVVIGGIDFLKGEERRQIVPDADVLNCRELAEKICQDNSGLFGYVPNKLYCLPLLRKAGVLFDEKMYCQEDLDFALRVYGSADTFALLDYSGYLYYQSGGKRILPQNDLMKNRLSIYHLACSAGASEEVISGYVSVIKKSLVKVLTYARDCETIESLGAVPGLMEVLSVPTKEKLFTKALTKLFAGKQFAKILFITNTRRKLRSIVRR